MSLTTNPDVARELWVRVDNYAAKHLLTAATWTEFFTSTMTIYHDILAERSIPAISANSINGANSINAPLSGEQRTLIREFISFFDDLLTAGSDSVNGKYAKATIKSIGAENIGQEKKDDKVYFLQIDKDLRVLLLEILRTSAVSTVKHFLSNYHFSTATADKVDVTASRDKQLQLWNERQFTDNIARSLHVSLRGKMNLWVVDDNNWYVMVAHGASYLRSVRPPLLPERQQALLNEVLPTIMHEACIHPEEKRLKSSPEINSSDLIEVRMNVFRQLISPLIATIYQSAPLSILVSAIPSPTAAVPTSSCASCDDCCVVM